jgi:hypothetical protein
MIDYLILLHHPMLSVLNGMLIFFAIIGVVVIIKSFIDTKRGKDD